jgi:hypothetical protein
MALGSTYNLGRAYILEYYNIYNTSNGRHPDLYATNQNHRCNVIKIISNKKFHFLQMCYQDSLNVEYLMLYHGLFLKIFDSEFTTHRTLIFYSVVVSINFIINYISMLHYAVHYTLLKYIRVIHRNFYNRF